MDVPYAWVITQRKRIKSKKLKTRRLDSAASFVLNQLQKYNSRDCEMKWKSRCIHLGTLSSIVFVCKNKEIEVSGQFKLCSWAHVFLKADLSNPQWHTLIATFAWNSSLSSCQYTHRKYRSKTTGTAENLLFICNSITPLTWIGIATRIVRAKK